MGEDPGDILALALVTLGATPLVVGALLVPMATGGLPGPERLRKAATPPPLLQVCLRVEDDGGCGGVKGREAERERVMSPP